MRKGKSRGYTDEHPKSGCAAIEFAGNGCGDADWEARSAPG